jgi:excisionase family DNA binding protein
MAAAAPEYLSTAQAAALLGLSRTYVVRLFDRGSLSGETVPANPHPARRVTRESVEAYLARRPPAPPPAEAVSDWVGREVTFRDVVALGFGGHLKRRRGTVRAVQLTAVGGELLLIVTPPSKRYPAGEDYYRRPEQVTLTEEPSCASS